MVLQSKKNDHFINFLSQHLEKDEKNICGDNPYWLLPIPDGMRIAPRLVPCDEEYMECDEEQDSDIRREHWGIYQQIDKYFRNDDDYKNESFSSQNFNKCFSSMNPDYKCRSESTLKPIRFIQKLGGVRIRCSASKDYKELNIELNTAQTINKIQKNQLKDLWCEIKKQSSSPSLNIDIITKYRSDLSIHWNHTKTIDFSHLPCDQAIEKTIDYFNTIKDREKDIEEYLDNDEYKWYNSSNLQTYIERIDNHDKISQYRPSRSG